MYDRLGIPGIVGVLIFLGGLGVIAWQNPIIAGGVALVVAGLGLFAYGLITNLLEALGMGAML